MRGTRPLLLGFLFALAALLALGKASGWGSYALTTYVPWRDRAIGVEFMETPGCYWGYMGKKIPTYGLVLPVGRDGVLQIGSYKRFRMPTCCGGP